MIYPNDFHNKLIHGDCLEVIPHIPDQSIDLILCDLPFSGFTRNHWDQPINLEKLWVEYKRIIKDNGVIALNANQPFASELILASSIPFKYEWIWEKDNGTGFLNAKKQPLRKHESVLVFYKNQSIYNPQFTEGKPYKQLSGKQSSNYNDQIQVLTDNTGIRYPTTILKFARDKNKVHPTQKPVALMEYMIKTYTNEGMVVLDNAVGSGSTLIAARNLNRIYIGIEKDKEIYEQACQRLAGEKPRKSESYKRIIGEQKRVVPVEGCNNDRTP